MPRFGAFALFPSFWIVARKNSLVVTWPVFQTAEKIQDIAMDDEEALLYGDGDVGDNAGQAENEQLKENIESTEFQLEQETGDPVSINYSDFLSGKASQNE